jgi:hypothetical protein
VVSYFDPMDWPPRLNLGCGWDKRPGYLNIDFGDWHEPDLLADVRDLSMLPSGHYEEIVAQDVLEHLKRDDAPAALARWASLLKDGGKLILRVPNLIGLAWTFTWKQTIENQQELVQCLYGTQAYDGDFHQNGYTELLLRHELRNVGLGQAEFEPYHEWLFDVVATKAPPEGPLRYEDCIYMSWGKPSAIAEAHAAGQPLTWTAGYPA